MPSTFVHAVKLPVFHDDQQDEALVDAYEVLSQPYVNGINKVEIQPLRYDGPERHGRCRPLVPIGQPYTIRPAHLTRLIVSQTP